MKIFLKKETKKRARERERVRVRVRVREREREREKERERDVRHFYFERERHRWLVIFACINIFQKNFSIVATSNCRRRFFQTSRLTSTFSPKKIEPTKIAYFSILFFNIFVPMLFYVFVFVSPSLWRVFVFYLRWLLKNISLIKLLSIFTSVFEHNIWSDSDSALAFVSLMISDCSFRFTFFIDLSYSVTFVSNNIFQSLELCYQPPGIVKPFCCHFGCFGFML